MFDLYSFGMHVQTAFSSYKIHVEQTVRKSNNIPRTEQEEIPDNDLNDVWFCSFQYNLAVGLDILTFQNENHICT